MNTTTAAQMARTLLDQHGLTEWRVEFDRAKRRLGQCRYSTRTIGLGRDYVLHNDENLVRDTILHEIAHALVGPGAGHGLVWKNKCREIGARPVARKDWQEVNSPPGAWEGRCGCGVSKRHRRPKYPHAVFQCRVCRVKFSYYQWGTTAWRINVQQEVKTILADALAEERLVAANTVTAPSISARQPTNSPTGWGVEADAYKQSQLRKEARQARRNQT